MTAQHPTPERSAVFKALVLLVLALSACASNPIGLQGRWVGTVKPISGNCDPASQAVLTIEGGGRAPYAATFAPTNGALILQGNSDGISQVAADLHTTGMNHQPYTLAFSGVKNGDSIAGTYITQRCRSDVKLARK